MRKTLLFFFFLVFLVRIVYAQDTANLYKIKYYNQKVQKYLDKENALSNYYLIDKEGIKMFASAQDKLNKKVEFELNYSQFAAYSKYIKENNITCYKKGTIELPAIINNKKKEPNSGNQKLKGYKIAIDPGHIAADFATGDLEKKHLKFPKDSLQGLNDSIEIAEGMLTFATAAVLKEKLEAQGAEVFLTRKNGESAFGKTFEQWKKEDYKKAIDSLFKIGEIKKYQRDYFYSNKTQDRDIFRVIFRDLDLAKRAALINNFKPDFTIIIHYNVDETNLEWIKPTTKNFNMTFVGGAFMKNDLSTIEKRFEFLRMVISDDIEKSILLSSETIKYFEKNLNVKTAQQSDAKYLAEGSIATDKKGVFCRNLQLTRYVHSPLVYGETLYQDNINECKLLNAETDKSKNKRVQQVAEAYYQGILNYVLTLTNN